MVPGCLDKPMAIELLKSAIELSKNGCPWEHILRDELANRRFFWDSLTVGVLLYSRQVVMVENTGDWGKTLNLLLETLKE